MLITFEAGTSKGGASTALSPALLRCNLDIDGIDWGRAG